MEDSCSDPFWNMCEIIRAAYEGDLHYLKSVEPTTILARKSCCYAFSALHFTTFAGNVDCFVYLVEIGQRYEEIPVSKFQPPPLSPELKIMIERGYIRKSIEWDKQKLLWMGRKDPNCAFSMLQKDLIMEIIKHCTIRIPCIKEERLTD